MQVLETGPAEVARIADAQRGLITRAQLAAAGVGRGAVAHWVRTGRLHPRLPGVFSVGRAGLGALGPETAAVLCCEGDAVLSHGSAAALWGLLERFPEQPTVVIRHGRRRSRPGLTVHRTNALAADEIRIREGLPLTSPARTIMDLARSASDDELEQATGAARVRRLLRPGELERQLASHPRRPGVGRLHALLAARDPAFTRSRAEQLLLRLLRDAQLPAPVVNGRVLGYEVDFLWPSHRLIVEVDGYQFHGDRVAFERDRDRDRRLSAAGYTVIRVTWRQLRDAPLAVVASLAMALGFRAA